MDRTIFCNLTAAFHLPLVQAKAKAPRFLPDFCFRGPSAEGGAVTTVSVSVVTGVSAPQEVHQLLVARLSRAELGDESAKSFQSESAGRRVSDEL